MTVKSFKFSKLPFELLVKIGRIIFPKYRFKWHDIDWWESKKFDHFLKMFDNYKKFNDDRLWSLSELLRLTRYTEGDTAECGVYRGTSSTLICRENQESNLNKTHHVFDSFEGLSAAGDKDGSHWVAGDLACSLDEVKKALSEFTEVKYYKGWIPDRFEDVKTRMFSFVHIDVDLYQPTRDSFEFFYDRMSVGGVIVCDDYGFTTCPGATKAIDEILESKCEKMLTLSSGGGFIIKGVQTGTPLYR